jgi:hypothetical protein
VVDLQVRGGGAGVLDTIGQKNAKWWGKKSKEI